MKKVIIFLVLAFFLASCGGDENGTESDNKENGYFPANIPNKSPVIPYQQQPEEKETVFPNVRLTWNCYDPDGDPLLYDLYINGKLTASSISNQFYEVKLECGLTYEWYVSAKDNHGNKTVSPIWSFNTIPLMYIADVVVVRASSYLSWKMALKKGDKIQSEITSDNTVNVWLITEKEFDSFVKEEEFNFFREGSKKKIINFKYDFFTPETGEYRIVLDNTFSWFTPKNVTVFVYWSHYLN